MMYHLYYIYMDLVSCRWVLKTHKDESQVLGCMRLDFSVQVLFWSSQFCWFFSSVWILFLLAFLFKRPDHMSVSFVMPFAFGAHVLLPLVLMCSFTVSFVLTPICCTQGDDVIISIVLNASCEKYSASDVSRDLPFSLYFLLYESHRTGLFVCSFRILHNKWNNSNSFVIFLYL